MAASLSLQSHNQMRIGIVGGGMSGLALALRFCQKIPEGQPTHIRIFESNPFCGGRMHTKVVTGPNNQKIFLDMGANLIDFQNQHSKKEWHRILPPSISQNLKLLNRPFLIHEGSEFRKGDYEKDRYYYSGGFPKLIQDLISSLNSERVTLKCNHQVVSLRVQPPQVHLRIKNKQKNEVMSQIYDKVYLACPSHQVLKMLSDSDQQEVQTQKLINYCKHIEYTKQISIAFGTKEGIDHDFSCVLFKNHPVLSFICSHQEKYNQNIYVAQIAQKFSEKYFLEDEHLIVKQVYESLPSRIRQMTDHKHLLIWRWPISLIRPPQLLPELVPGKYISLIGDSAIGKSRVSNAVQSVSKM